MNSQSLLLSHELAIIPTASKYNLYNKSHLIHSNKSLFQLFFSLTQIIRVHLFLDPPPSQHPPPHS